MELPYTFYDQEALLQRLTTGITRRAQEVIFLVGAPLSAPVSPGSLGVPGVDGVIDLIRREFESNNTEKEALESELTKAGSKAYQAAFSFLQGRRGQHIANEIVGKAVLGTRIPTSLSIPIDFANQSTAETACQTLDLDTSGWHLNPGIENLGRLATDYADIFGNVILTTNFDPLIEVAIQRAGGTHYRTTLYSDGNLYQTRAPGCHVIHLHGFWHGADTLHTPRQLNQPRPHLKDSLKSLLRDKLVVACAYSGWDDVLTDSLMDVVRDLTEYPEVLWTFYPPGANLSEHLQSRLGPGLDRGRVNLYSGIDCNILFPLLYERWRALKPAPNRPTAIRSNPVHVTAELSAEVAQQEGKPRIIEGNDEDRPPLVDICVGREDELRRLKEPQARVVFLTGIGGQGKSTVAAKYFVDCQLKGTFSFFVWRDCKEERERFENQLSSVVETLSEGRVSGEDLAHQGPESIIEVLLALIKDRRVLFTFDNVDHYVDLERGKLTGIPNLFVLSLLGSESPSRAVFTCRPEIEYAEPLAGSIHLEGISLNAAVELFTERGAQCDREEIEEAHGLTKGHVFWLDLLAIQAVKRGPAITLHNLLAEVGSGADLLPEDTLRSIWRTLREREQTVLRAMAETLKPETDVEVSDYLSGEFGHNKVVKALKTLRALNLIVIKKPPKGPDLLELHPMVRHFIRNNFPEKERISYINRIIAVYQRFIGSHKSDLSRRPTLVVLQYWTQSAELDIAAGRFEDAFSILGEVSRPFLGSAYPREFTRTARVLFETADWVARHSEYSRFEDVFAIHIHLLCDLGETGEVDSLLEKYEITVPNKDARYIRYCDLRCYSKWVRGDFIDSVRWGKVGHDLKTSSGVDTKYDVSHNLALAERDSGRPESALTTFLSGRSLEEVTDPRELDGRRDGAHYGNIGRCLHLMGQIDSALICYQKSALLLEKAPQQHTVNQGYIRAWIAELLIGREQFTLAYIFLRAAYLKWEQASPPKAIRVHQLELGIRDRIKDPTKVDPLEVEGICRDWILGKNLDLEFG